MIIIMRLSLRSQKLEPFNDKGFVVQFYFSDWVFTVCCSHPANEAAFTIEINILKCHTQIACVSNKSLVF